MHLRKQLGESPNSLKHSEELKSSYTLDYHQNDNVLQQPTAASNSCYISGDTWSPRMRALYDATSAISDDFWEEYQIEDNSPSTNQHDDNAPSYHRHDNSSPKQHSNDFIPPSLIVVRPNSTTMWRQVDIITTSQNCRQSGEKELPNWQEERYPQRGLFGRCLLRRTTTTRSAVPAVQIHCFLVTRQTTPYTLSWGSGLTPEIKSRLGEMTTRVEI